MSKLAVRTLPEKGGVCTTAQLLVHALMFPLCPGYVFQWEALQ